MKRDLEAAARVQQDLLPTELPVNGPVRFSWTYRPCDALGGDILDIFPIGDSHFGFYLIDVVGHGVPASLLAVTLTRTLDVIPDHPCLVCRPSGSGALEPAPPDEVAHRLNAHFQMDEQSNQYFTLFYGVIDCRTRELQFVTAGHPGPAHVPSEAAPVDLTTPAFPIGMSDDPGYEVQSITLNPGDRLYVNSDGIGEVQNGAGRMLGRGGISDTLATTHSLSLEASLERLIEVAADWSRGSFDDDVSAVAVEIATAAATPD